MLMEPWTTTSLIRKCMRLEATAVCRHGGERAEGPAAAISYQGFTRAKGYGKAGGFEPARRQSASADGQHSMELTVLIGGRTW